MNQTRVVLHVVPWPVYGGPHNEARLFGTYAASSGWTTIVALPIDAAPAARHFAAPDMRVVQMPLHRLRRSRSIAYWVRFPARFVKDVVLLATLIRRERCVVVESSGPNLAAAIAARLTGTPLVWRVADVSSPRPVRFLLGLVLPRLADMILVNGLATMGQYPGLASRGNTTIYYPPIDESLSAVQERRRNPGDLLVIGTVANLNPDKGLEVLVEAAGLLRDLVDVRFVVVGSEHDTHRSYASRLYRLVYDRQLEDRFSFVGGQIDVREWLGMMDIFVISSHREGTTTTAIEAMAAGLPVVATRVGAIPEVVSDHLTGLVVGPADPVGLARALRSLVSDPSMRTRYGEAGREAFVGRFTTLSSLAPRLATYEALTNPPGHRGGRRRLPDALAAGSEDA